MADILSSSPSTAAESVLLQVGTCCQPLLPHFVPPLHSQDSSGGPAGSRSAANSLAHGSATSAGLDPSRETSVLLYIVHLLPRIQALRTPDGHLSQASLTTDWGVETPCRTLSAAPPVAQRLTPERPYVAMRKESALSSSAQRGVSSPWPSNSETVSHVPPSACAWLAQQAH